MKLKKIEIHNFRAFKDVVIDFNDFNCIIGKNDAGKSTIFAALEWFFTRDKELNNYDINTNAEEDDKDDISVELYFIEATFHDEYTDEELLDEEGCICVKKVLENPNKFDSDYVKPVPYYSLRIFKREGDLNSEGHRRFTESEWSEYLYESVHFSVPLFMLSTPQTPINYYLNNLFNNRLPIFDNNETTKIAEAIADAIGSDESIEVYPSDCFDIDFFPNEKKVPINTIIDSNIIPLQNRGDGFQQKVKNAVFKLLAGAKGYSYIFAFEEPETHLHPSAQIEMFKTIKALSENSNYQVIITTHSPYIVKELANDNIYPIVVKRNEKNNESIITSLNNERVLPYSSMNELNYVAFDYASEEFHQELYGKIEIDWFGESNGCKIGDIINSLNKCDFKPSNRQIKFKDILSKIIEQFNHDNNSNLDLLKNKFISPDKDPQDYTLCHCVRNAIDHPCEGNNKWKHNQIVELSIKILLEINNFLVDIEKQFKNIVEKGTENLDDFGEKIDYYVNEEKQSHSIVFWTYHCHYKDLKVKITKKDKTPVKKTMKDVKKALEIMGKQLST